MKTLFAIFTALGFVLFTVSMGSAHLRLDETFVAPRVPDDIEVDGDGSEWQMYPRQYYLTHDDLKETVKGGFDNPNPASLAVKVVIGWSPVTNMIYFWEERCDDHSNARLTADDREENIEFGIDADHSGGQYMGMPPQDRDPDRHNSAQAQSYRYYLNRDNPLSIWGSATWADKPPYADIGWSFHGTVGGEGVQTVEIAVTPFDDLNSEGIDQSVVHTLKAGDIIGLVFAVKDSDDPDDLGYDGGWWTNSHAAATNFDASTFVDYILLDFEPVIIIIDHFDDNDGVVEADSSEVGADTWGRIKSTFSN